MPKTTHETVKELHDEKKLSFAQIGKILGITRQRAHQIYHRKHR